MKKTLLLTIAAVALMSATEANAEFRKWDFTKWSTATINNLQAGAFANAGTINPESGWSDVEKTTGTAPTDLSAGNCFWESTAQGNAAGVTLTANGETIAELEGLLYTNTAARSLAIALNYQGPLSDGCGPYHGPAYLWCGSKTKNYFVIPNVAVGEKIYIGVESHKSTEARGVELYVYTSNNARGTKILGEDGAEAPAVTIDYTDQVWQVQEGLEDTPNEDGTYNIVIRNTNGCHLYYIQVGEGQGSNMEDMNIAYLYDSSYNGYKVDGTPAGYAADGGLDVDPVYITLMDYNVTAIDYNSEEVKAMTSAELNDSLLNFDVVVASEAVSSGNTYAKGLKDIINKVPLLNLKSFMYKKGVWDFGAGSNPSPKANSITVAEDYLEDPLFADVTSMDENGTIQLFKSNPEDITAGNLVQGYTVTEGSLIAEDAVIATVGDGINAIHSHGTKNQYMLIPLSSDHLLADGDFNLTDDALTIIRNAVNILAATKSKVQNAAMPIISQEPADGVTTVSISCVSPGATIFYTTDGTDPTAASTVYTEPFEVTEDGLVVKAFAQAHGYNDSNIATATITVKTQALAPSIDIKEEAGQTVVTLTGEEGTNIYFNFQGLTASATSQLYTEPIVLTEPATITMFAESATKLTSPIYDAEIEVAGIFQPIDTVAHFNAGQTDWYDNVVITVGENSYGAADAVSEGIASGSASAIYYFGKSAWNYYSDVVDHTEIVYDEDGVTPLKDINGNDSIKTIYVPDAAAFRKITSTTDTQWTIETEGQVVTGETNLKPEVGVGNGATGRYAETAFDAIGTPTNGVVDFGGKVSGEPYTMRVVSNEKFAAPFDVVIYLGNGSTGSPNIEIQVSADGENWTKIGDVNFCTTQRYWKKTRVHQGEEGEFFVRLAQVGGSSKAQLYDVLVITTTAEVGIEEISEDNVRGKQQMFDLYGRQIQAPAAGQIFILNGKKTVQF